MFLSHAIIQNGMLNEHGGVACTDMLLDRENARQAFSVPDAVAEQHYLRLHHGGRRAGRTNVGDHRVGRHLDRSGFTSASNMHMALFQSLAEVADWQVAPAGRKANRLSGVGSRTIRQRRADPPHRFDRFQQRGLEKWTASAEYLARTR